MSDNKKPPVLYQSVVHGQQNSLQVNGTPDPDNPDGPFKSPLNARVRYNNRPGRKMGTSVPGIDAQVDKADH